MTIITTDLVFLLLFLLHLIQFGKIELYFFLIYLMHVQNGDCDH
jgi:hypothetical protein